MKVIIILVSLGLMIPTAQAWRCDLTDHSGVSEVDRCFGRILTQFVHQAKTDVVKHWQSVNTAQGLAKAGAEWSRVESMLKQIQVMNDLIDHSTDSGIYRIPRDITLTCSDDD